LHSKRTRREDAGGNLGCAEEESYVPQVEAGKVEGGAEGLDRQETAAADAIADTGAAAKAGLAWSKEATAAEVVVSRPAADEVVAGEIATIEASSGPISQGDPREAVREAMKEVLAGMRASELPEMVALASSSPGPMPGVTTDMPTPETEIGTAAGSLLFVATSDPERAS
jgi:hypothetical protein